MGLLSRLQGTVEGIGSFLKGLYYSTELPTPKERLDYAASLEKEGRWGDAFLEYTLAEDGLGSPAGENINIPYFYYTRGFSALRAGYIRQACEDALNIHINSVDIYDEVYLNNLLGLIFYEAAEEELRRGGGEWGLPPKSTSLLFLGASHFLRAARDILASLGITGEIQAFAPRLYKSILCGGKYEMATGLAPGGGLGHEGLPALAKSLYLSRDYKWAYTLFSGLLSRSEEEGGLDEVAESALWLGYTAIRLGDIGGATRYLNRAIGLSLSQSDYSGMARLALLWIGYQTWREGRGSVDIGTIEQLLNRIEPGDLLTFSCGAPCDPPPFSMEEVTDLFSRLLLALAESGRMEGVKRASLLFGTLAYYARSCVDEVEIGRIRKRVFSTIDRLIRFGDVVASWEKKVPIYVIARELAASLDPHLSDLDTVPRYAKATRLLAGSAKEEDRYGRYSTFFREAAELMFDRGGLSWLDMDCKALQEFSLALSEYKEDIVDAGSDVRWEIGIYSALSSLAISERVFRCFPEDPMAIIDMAWDIYYSSKRERQRFDESITFSKAVLEMMYERFKEGSVSAEEFTSSVRVFAWSLIMKAVGLVNSGQLDLAREILERDRVIDYLHMAELYERDVRWRRDLLYAINGYYYLMGRILDRDRVYRASKVYPDCPLLSTLDQLGQDSPLAIEYLDRSISYLRELAPYEERRWMITRLEGKALAYKGDFSSAVRILEGGLREVPTDKPNQVVSMEDGLIAALKGEICYGGVPPEKKEEDVIRLLEVTWDSAKEKKHDPSFMRHELFPVVKGVSIFVLKSPTRSEDSMTRIGRVIDEIKGYMQGDGVPKDLKKEWVEVYGELGLDKGN